MFVPVLSSTGQPLMPTRPARANRLLKSGRAYSFWSRGVFCIRMRDVAEGKTQTIAVGIDPGSKREAFTVKSEDHTFLNVLADARVGVLTSRSQQGETLGVVADQGKRRAGLIGITEAEVACRLQQRRVGN